MNKSKREKSVKVDVHESENEMKMIELWKM